MSDRYLLAFPGLLMAWSGPASTLTGDTVEPVDIRDGEAWMRDGGFWQSFRLEEREMPNIRLDTHRPEVIAHLLRWLHAQGKPAHHLRPVWLGGSLTDEEAGQALAWSVRSVRSDGEVLQGVYDCWAEAAPGSLVRWPADPTDPVPPPCVGPYGWYAFDQSGKGWTNDADNAALAAGYALRQPDGTVTYPPSPAP